MPLLSPAADLASSRSCESVEDAESGEESSLASVKDDCGDPGKEQHTLVSQSIAGARTRCFSCLLHVINETLSHRNHDVTSSQGTANVWGEGLGAEWKSEYLAHVLI